MDVVRHQFLRHSLLVLATTICLHLYVGNNNNNKSVRVVAFTVLPSCSSLHGTTNQINHIGQSLSVFVHNNDNNNNNSDTGGLLRLPTTTTDDDDNTVLDMLHRMTLYFSDMVDVSTNRFYALSRPPTGEKIHIHCPLRDLGVAWDATTLLLFWKNQQKLQQKQQQPYFLQNDDCFNRLQTAVQGTLEAYSSRDALVWRTHHDNGSTAARISTKVLHEPSNIAHSGFLILVTTGVIKLSSLYKNKTNEDNNVQGKLPLMDALTKGILSMQRPDDGAFRIEFGDGRDEDDNIYKGIEFYPGEAMVALLEVHQELPELLEDSTKAAVLPAIQRAFDFYADYYRKGNADTNYNIWQVQAFARFFYALHDNDEHLVSKQEAAVVADYVLELCRDIVTSQSWRMLSRGRSFYPNLQTVEIACGLDAIIEGVRVALILARDEDTLLLWSYVNHAIEFLKFVQDQVPSDAAAGFGGLGYGGIQVFEQRLDVTGHAISALTKAYRVVQDSRL